MKSKTPLLFGGLFILLVIVYLLTSFHPPEKTKGAVQLFRGERPVINKLEFESKQYGHIVIEEQNGVWNITEPLKYKASEVSVKNTITDLLGIAVDGVISDRVEAQHTYEVSDSTGTAFKVYSNDKLVLDAIVGKYSTDLGHTYARLNGSNEIYLWRGLFSQSVNRGIDEWRDKIIYSFNPVDILSIKAVQNKVKTVELTLADSIWTYTENGTKKPVDQGKVKGIVSAIASLRCDAFADEMDIPRAHEKEPDTHVSFTVRNGDIHSYDVWTPGEEDAGRYLVRTENVEEIFRFYQYRGSQIVIDYESIMADKEE